MAVTLIRSGGAESCFIAILFFFWFFGVWTVNLNNWVLCSLRLYGVLRT